MNHRLQSAINPIIGSFQAQMSACSVSATVTPSRVTPNDVDPAEVINEFEEQTPENAEVNADGSPTIPVAEEIIFSDMTKERLLQIASDAGIKVVKSWTKAKIIAAIEAETVGA